MSGFPNLSNIDPIIAKKIKERNGTNSSVSSLMPWFRAVSLVGKGLIIDSTWSDDSFTTRYGGSGYSGRIGKAKDNKTSIYPNQVLLELDENGDEIPGVRDNRGYRPSPTIDSVSVKNGSEGLTRKCSFNIKCYTQAQADAIAAHFLEPAFYVLIEFGWNTPESYSQRAGGGEAINTCEVVKYSNLGVLKDKRANSNGTYDAFLGVITGGGITYGEGETYEVAVELTSQGELPAYLSHHKGIPTNAIDAAGGIKFSTKEIEETADDPNSIGKGLFMQMYNKLPLPKQIKSIKDFSNNPKWIDETNFLNMDDEIREDYAENLKKTAVRNKEDADLEIPSDTPLLSTEKFIRFELAYEILKTTAEPTILDTECKDYMSNSGESLKIQKISDIDISNTKCRAHKYMFSTDKSKLYIANKYLPDFGLVDALTSRENASIISFNRTKIDEEKMIDGHPYTTNPDLKNKYFPSQEDGPTETYKWDNTIISPKPTKYQYGYLKNLYINFDFFCECMERKGYMTYEVLRQMLNGMASAVNMHWDFQFQEVGNGEGCTSMVVVDMTYLGASEIGKQLDDNGIPSVVKTKFQSRGINSPFLDAELDIDIPGAMANMIISQRNSTDKKNPDDGPNSTPGSSPEIQKQNLERGVFTALTDPVAKTLDNINGQIGDAQKEIDAAVANAETKQKIEETDTWDYAWDYAKKRGDNIWKGATKVGAALGLVDESDTPEGKARTANYDYFIERAGVFPKVNNRKISGRVDAGVMSSLSALFSEAGSGNLEDLLFVGTYDDSTLLKQFEQLNEDICKEDGKDDTVQNPVLLPIKFTFTIHGISGLKVGDMFRVTDLPKKYAKSVFQIIQIEHDIADLWKTKVEAKIRNM